jgi:hypothetical protein
MTSNPSVRRGPAELQLLRIYFHRPDQRATLDRMFEGAGFEFQNQSHQTIWGIFGTISRLHSGDDWTLVIDGYLADAEPEVLAVVRSVVNLTEVGRINVHHNPEVVAQGVLATIAKMEAKARRSEYLAELANQPLASAEECRKLAEEQGGADSIASALRKLNPEAYRWQELIAQQDVLISEADTKRRAKSVL